MSIRRRCKPGMFVPDCTDPLTRWKRLPMKCPAKPWRGSGMSASRVHALLVGSNASTAI